MRHIAQTTRHASCELRLSASLLSDFSERSRCDSYDLWVYQKPRSDGTMYDERNLFREVTRDRIIHDDSVSSTYTSA